MQSKNPFAQLLQDVNLDQSLLMESFLVADDLDGNKASCLMIDATYNLSEATLAEQVNDLVPIGEMVAKDYVIVTTIIIVSEVGGLRVEVTDMFLSILRAAEIDLFVVYNFASFKDVQVDHLQSLCWRNALLRHSTLAKCIDVTCRMLKVLAFRSELLHLLVRHQVISV